jgi:hypothetical protein
MQHLRHMNMPCHYSLDLAKERMTAAMERGLHPFCEFPEHDKTLVIVGNGPSLKTQIRAIRDRKARGGVIMTVQGADKFLLSKGVVPDFVALLDGCDGMERYIQPDRRISYLVASIVHPGVFDALDGCPVILWHADMGRGEHDFMQETFPDRPWCMIGGGCTIGLRCINLGYLMGFRKMHVYGMDSSIDRGHYAAEAEALTGVRATEFDVVCAGRTFKVVPYLAQQAQDFSDLMRKTFAGKIDIIAHGDGLIPHICRTMRKAGECQRKAA